MYELASKPRSIEQLLRSAIELYKITFVEMLPLALIAALAAVIERGYVLIYIAPDRREELFLDPRYLLVVLVTLLIDLVAYGAMWALADFAAQRERMHSLRALGIGIRALPTMAASTILFIFSVTVGMLLLIVPGVIVSVSFFLYGPAIILERKGIIASLGESHRLVQGNWWHTAIIQTAGFGGVLLFAVLVLWTLDVLLAIVGAASGTALVIELLAAAAVAVITTSFSIILMLEIYRDLKLRKQQPGAIP
jgi:hypothetical protein